MSVLIVGSTALDSIKTPHAENPRLLGGSASHAAVAASFFGPVKLVGVVVDHCRLSVVLSAAVDVRVKGPDGPPLKVNVLKEALLPLMPGRKPI